MSKSKDNHTDKYRDIVENVSDIIYELDNQGYYTYANPATITVSGYSFDELKQKQYTDLIPEEDLNAFFVFFGQQKESKTPVTQREFRIKDKSGNIIWLNQTTKMFFEEGKLVRVLAVAQNINEIKGLRSDLQAQSEMYKLVSENSQDLIAVHEPDGTYKFISPSVKDILGYSPDELIGTNPYQLIHEKDHYRLQQGPHNATLKGETKKGIEYRLKHKNGHYVWMEAYTKPIFDKDGQLTSFQTSSRDITKKKQAEQAIQKSEASLKALIENTTDTICALDNDLRYITFNTALKNFMYIGTGHEPRVGEKMNFEDLGPHIKEKWMSLIKRAQNGERFMEVMRFNISNVNLYFENHFNPILDENNEVIGVSAFGRNITAKKEEENKIKRFQEGLKLINTLASDVITDVDTLLERALKIVCDFLSMPLGIISKIAGDNYIVKHYHTNNHSFQLKKGQVFDLKRTYCDLTLRNNHVTSISHMKVSEYSGHPCYKDFNLEAYIGAYITVGNKKYGTINFSSQNQRTKKFDIYDEDFIVLLANWVGSVLTRHKNELQLKKAKAAAEIASEAKANFLSVMSHEIRTPLNGIIGLTHILLQEEPRDDQLKNLNLLKFSGENLLVIINDILDFNKIESGKILLEEVDFNLYALLDSIKLTNSFKCEEKGISFDFHYDKKLPEVFIGDSVRIAQVINNLVSNAIKFTENGTVRLSAHFVKLVDKKVELKITVKDTGIGIKEENFDKIFQRFSQEEVSTTRKFGGSGLGLSITKKLLGLMNSEVHLDSTEGEGSTFHFKLKLPVGNEKLSLITRGHSLDFQNLEEHNISVLIAEDNRVNHLVAKKFLNQWGIDADHAEDGQVAVEKVLNNKYDLVLMDLQMPNMDGFEACKQIKEKFGTKLPILALTASVLSEVRNKAKEAGMSDFITKPFTPHDLYDKITKNLNLTLNQKKQVAEKSKPIVDQTDLQQILNDFSAGDQAFKKELIQLYIQNAEELKDIYTEALANKNEDAAKKIVHKMHTTLRTLKCDELINQLNNGINLIQNNSSTDSQGIEINNTIDKLIKDLKAIL
ncbi:MAG: PAS domain S-box protein [Fulvivirga sp.]